MKSLKVILVLILFSFTIKGQHYRFLNTLDSLKTDVQLTSENFYQSNFLTQTIANDIIFSRFISSEDVDRMQNKLNKSKNLLHLETRQNIDFKYKINHTLGLGLNVGDRLLSFGNFSGDFMRLLSEGNRTGDAKTYDFSGTQLSYTRFQEIGLSVYYQTQQNFVFRVNANYLNGESLTQLNLKNSSFYVNAPGTQTQIILSGDLAISDSTNKKYAAQNGQGFSLNFSFSANYHLFKNQEKSGKLNLFLFDVGRIAFNEQTAQYKQNNNTYQFNGVVIDNIANYPSNIFQQQSPEYILDSVLNTMTQQKLTYTLPFAVGFSIIQPILKNSTLAFGANFRNVFGARPMVFAQLNTPINPWLSLHANTNLFGFGNASLGGGLTIEQNKLKIQISTAHLNSLFLPTHQAGLGVQMSLNYHIK